jgi:hypothetical protein
MTECVCEFKRPRSSSLGQCTRVFVLLRTILLTFTHFHKLTCTHTFNKSVGESVFCTLKVYLYYCQDNLESFIHYIYIYAFGWRFYPRCRLHMGTKRQVNFKVKVPKFWYSRSVWEMNGDVISACANFSSSCISI